MIRRHWATLAAAAIVLTAAYGMKGFYSQADADDLGWILKPTAALTAAFSGRQFEAETGEGFLNREAMVRIAPACAGVNFLIIAFCMSALYGAWRIPSPAGKAAWIAVSAATAYGLAIGVNMIRILLSMALYEADIHAGHLTPERLHRIGGTAVYYLCLYLYFVGISRILNRGATPASGAASWRIALNSLWPLICYLGFSLGVPLLNAAYPKAPDRFTEHAVMVAAVSIGIGLTAILAQQACGRRKNRIESP